MTGIIGDVATLRNGYPFRAGLSPDPDGTIQVVQGRDVEPDRLEFHPAEPLVRLAADGHSRMAEHFLRPGDVLLMARGPRNYAAVVGENVVSLGPLIAVGSFHVIAPDVTRLLPLYLAWWFAQQTAQTHFRASNTGTSIPMISLDAVRLAPIQLPPIAVQQRIADLSVLFTRERDTAESLYAERCRWLSLWARHQTF